MDRFADCLSPWVDPRKTQAQQDLSEMLSIALLATLCGATTCCDIALFGRSKEALLRTILVLEHGIPSHDT
ncbi:MAG: transposase family protein, partial [Bradyrhizobium sp.]|uniref:transposase family protein n=1 Tax=Bradyrhizobium sp. TaxID=376 RepID=UPI003C750720